MIPRVASLDRGKPKAHSRDLKINVKFYNMRFISPGKKLTDFLGARTIGGFGGTYTFVAYKRKPNQTLSMF